MGDWPFFGPDAERAVSRARRVTQAKAICASCAALLQCRVFAQRSGQTAGSAFVNRHNSVTCTYTF
jgi:hypothetical protein